MIFVGVDPGKRAGLAFVGEEPASAFDLSEDLSKTVHFLFSDAGRFEDATVFVEKVHAMPRQGVVSSFSFGRSLGQIEGVLAVLCSKIRYVRPQVWKAHFGLLKKDKRASLELARELFPSVALPLMKDHNKAEALLIAKYGYDTHGGKP